jgi:antitoxin component YwqK of YwqJK toxin-antitoxin module
VLSYHPNGKLAKREVYEAGAQQGEAEEFTDKGKPVKK